MRESGDGGGEETPPAPGIRQAPPELWRASSAATASVSSCLTRPSYHLFNASWKGRSGTQAWAVDHFVFRAPSPAAPLASPTRPLILAMAGRLALTAAAGIGSSG